MVGRMSFVPGTDLIRDVREYTIPHKHRGEEHQRASAYESLRQALDNARPRNAVVFACQPKTVGCP